MSGTQTFGWLVPAINYLLNLAGLQLLYGTPNEEKRGEYTRRDLLYKVAGTHMLPSSNPKLDRVRRIWPDEPNVGFVEERMAFKVDGAVRIGGPTLKTYDLNNEGTASAIRETRLYQDDTYGKLRGSENALEAADVFNAVGYWYSQTSPAAGDPVVWETEVLSDPSTYSFDTGIISILRPGVYRIGWRSWAVTDVGTLTVDLTVDSSSVQWQCANLKADEITVSDEMIYVQTAATPIPVVLTLTTGTSLGKAIPNHTALSILKMR